MGTRGDDSYDIFNPEQGLCSNDFIDLTFEYDIAYSNGDLKTEALIQHRLFLLGQDGSASDYTLSCDLKVCDRDDGSSDCNAWTSCLSQEQQNEYICDAEMESTCDASQSCVVDNSAATCEDNAAA